MTAHVWTLDGWTLIEGPAAGQADVVVHVDAVRGWYGSPAPRNQPQARPRGQGLFDAPGWRGGREIELVGYVAARSQDLLEDAMAGLAAICSDPVQLYELSCDTGSRVLTSSVRLADLVDVQPAGNWHADFTLALLAPDPLRYGPERTASTGLPTSGGGLTYPLTYPLDYGQLGATGQIVLDNDGTADAPVIFDVTGPHEQGFEISAAGQRITYPTPVPAGQLIRLNTADGSVLAEGTADRRSELINADWFLIPRRSSLTVQFTSLGGAYSPAANLLARWKPASW